MVRDHQACVINRDIQACCRKGRNVAHALSAQGHWCSTSVPCSYTRASRTSKQQIAIRSAGEARVRARDEASHPKLGFPMPILVWSPLDRSHHGDSCSQPGLDTATGALWPGNTTMPLPLLCPVAVFLPCSPGHDSGWRAGQRPSSGVSHMPGEC